MKLIIALASIAFAATALAQTNDTERKSVLTFLSHRFGYNQIYTSHSDGSKPKPFFGGPITDVPSFDQSYALFREPHWTRQSPNGKYFASWVFEKGKPYSPFQGVLRPMLVVGDTQGSWTRIVNPDCHEEFAWSPDSNQLAFSIFASANYRGTLQNRPDTTEVFTSGIDVYFSRYLPKDDDREKVAEDKEHGLSIWAVGRDGKNDRFITTGWSPDFRHTEPKDGK